MGGPGRTPRPVLAAHAGEPAADGDGVRLTRLLGSGAAAMFDPFLMLDHIDLEAGAGGRGFPDHPHRGFQTVTYMLDGRIRHRDSTGREGVIGPGGVQWMSAGRGVIHSETPETAEGRMRGFQLWVNLPARLKMSAPAYQEFGAADMPETDRPGGARVRCIAGRPSDGPPGPVSDPATEALWLDVALAPGGQLFEPLDPAFNAMAVVYEGEATIGGRSCAALTAAFLGAGDAVAAASAGGARLLVLAGRPIGEPVVWGGPFVMTTREDVLQAFEDYRSGRF